LIASGKSAKDINEELIQQHLYTKGQPDPDLIIRTGGELRISNFLIWQMSYSELYFTDTLWPDFDEKALDAALDEYKRRVRRFGGQDAVAAPTPSK
jgi:undecaprenyl diphosphate synthase